MTENDIAVIQEELYSELLYYFNDKKVPVQMRKIIMEGIYSRFLANAYTSIMNTLSQPKDKEQSSE